jgi:hypothetical protein
MYFKISDFFKIPPGGTNVVIAIGLITLYFNPWVDISAGGM